MFQNIRWFAAAVSVVFVAAVAQAESLELAWYTFDGGGHTYSSGGDFELGGTLGQFDAGPATGPMTGGQWELVGGFWPGVQPAGAPCGGFTPCDTNCDGSINGFDISNFILALSGAPSSCSPCNSDVNGDGSINGFDIGGFVACMSAP